MLSPPVAAGRAAPAGTPAPAVEPEGCEGGFGTQHPGDRHLERWHREVHPPRVSSNLPSSAVSIEFLPEHMNP